MWYETVIRDGKSHKRFERIGQFGPLLKQEGGVIESNIEEGCIVNGDPALLTRAVYNLIDNAVRHMGEDRKIIVSAKNGEFLITIMSSLSQEESRSISETSGGG